jgi:hypothetical protein
MKYRYTMETFYLSIPDEREKFTCAASGVDSIAAIDMSCPALGVEGGAFVTPDGVTHTLRAGMGYVFMREPVGGTNWNNPIVLDRILADMEALDPFEGGCPADVEGGR